MPEAVHIASGKVREIFALDDDRLLLVASDRISTFDVILPTPIPDKGRVLTGLSSFWFSRTAHIVPNHLLELRDDGRTMVCRKLQMLPIECVVRGYLTGSGWRDYSETGAVCGHVLPDGLAGLGPTACSDLHPGHKGERRSRREHRRGAGGRALRCGSLSCREGGLTRPVPIRLRARRRAWDHPGRHEVRARSGNGRRAHAWRRGADTRFVALLAPCRVRAWQTAALVRQAVCARLVRRDGLGQDATRGPSFPRTSSPGLARATSRPSNS